METTNGGIGTRFTIPKSIGRNRQRGYPCQQRACRTAVASIDKSTPEIERLSEDFNALPDRDGQLTNWAISPKQKY